MKQTKKKLRQFHKENHGSTLLEMIVSFALIGLFMVAATKVIINTISIYYEAKGIENGMQVCSILTSKIRGELESASTDKLASSTDDTSSSDSAAKTQQYAILLGADNDNTTASKLGDGIQITNSDNCRIYIGVNDSGYLVIYYYGNETTGKKSEGGVAIYTEQKEWTFDKNTYLGYTIQSLKFSLPGEDYNSNVIRMDLTVESGRYGSYSTTEYIECYNFDRDTNTLIGETTTK